MLESKIIIRVLALLCLALGVVSIVNANALGYGTVETAMKIFCVIVLFMAAAVEYDEYKKEPIW